MTRGKNFMEKIFHPVSGEVGFFCDEQEKILIDAILSDYSMNQLVLQEASTVDSRGGVNE